ncbi:MAG: TonB-dependent receptor [candidate division KSB1 bacterium]|nr:TonB-dependent receptor [candidate division KSB1 bacterium]
MVDLGLSLRYDRVTDQQRDAVFRSSVPDSMDGLQPQPFSRRRWQETTFKFALNFADVQNNLAVTSFIKFGLNAKFPTLLQQISSPGRLVADVRYQPQLQPERNRSMEIGVTAMRQLNDHPSVYGWSFFIDVFSEPLR